MATLCAGRLVSLDQKIVNSIPLELTCVPWPSGDALTLPNCRVQADRRALNITMNSIGTELTRDDRRKLYSNFGLLHPHGHSELAGAEDFDQIRNAMEKCPPYQAIFNKVRPPAPIVFISQREPCTLFHCVQS